MKYSENQIVLLLIVIVAVISVIIFFSGSDGIAKENTASSENAVVGQAGFASAQCPGEVVLDNVGGEGGNTQYYEIGTFSPTGSSGYPIAVTQDQLKAAGEKVKAELQDIIDTQVKAKIENALRAKCPQTCDFLLEPETKTVNINFELDVLTGKFSKPNKYGISRGLTTKIKYESTAEIETWKTTDVSISKLLSQSQISLGVYIKKLAGRLTEVNTKAKCTDKAGVVRTSSPEK